MTKLDFMKIELKNIGTVEHAEIDLDKNLLVFCGPNNSGKTYVAYALYGMYEILKVSSDDILEHWPQVEDHKEAIFKIKPELVKSILKERGRTIIEEFGNLFASNQQFFSNSKVTIELGFEEGEISEKINSLIIKNGRQTILSNHYTINKPKGSDSISIKNENIPLNIIDDVGYVSANRENYTLIIKSLIKSLFFGHSFIAPAERIAINIFSKEVYLNRAGLLDSPITAKSRYSLPIAASLRVAEDLSFLEKTQSDYASIAKQIEDRILFGSISISPYGEMQFNPHKADIKGMSINLAGSMVKSLASVVFYFRHLAQKGDFIIIDEPELNLHPDNQIIMARILARIVNEGFKVLISTHSDYIISELNNLVRLNSRKEKAKKIMDKYGYEKEELLDKDALGVYLFKDNIANSLEVDEFGFDISTIEKVNSDLAQTSESIYFDLFDKDDE